MPAIGRTGRATTTCRSSPSATRNRPRADEMKIENRVFLVTGGGSGLGEATARMLAAHGGKVGVADLNEAGAQGADSIGGGAGRAPRGGVGRAAGRAAP